MTSGACCLIVSQLFSFFHKLLVCHPFIFIPLYFSSSWYLGHSVSYFRIFLILFLFFLICSPWLSFCHCHPFIFFYSPLFFLLVVSQAFGLILSHFFSFVLIFSIFSFFPHFADFAKICQILSEFGKSCQKLSKNCLNLFKIVQYCLKLFKRGLRACSVAHV